MRQERIVEIRVKGEMSPQLREAFDDVEPTLDRGITRLVVVGRDASTLYGILDRLESFGLELIDLHSAEAPPASFSLGAEPRAEISNRIDRH
jgi:hypothetical protein